MIVIRRDMEYIKLFMEYESDDMPVVYFYEVDLKEKRFALRGIEVFEDRRVRLIQELNYDTVEICLIPTVDELNSKIWGEGFYATIISREEFEKIWATRIYSESIAVPKPYL